NRDARAPAPSSCTSSRCNSPGRCPCSDNRCIAVAALPLTARAQQAKVPLIGFLGTTSRSSWSKQVAAFEQRLRELGWIPGRTVEIEYRWTEGRNEQAREIADTFVRRNVDVIVAGGNAVAAVKQATTSIPIVFPV